MNDLYPKIYLGGLSLAFPSHMLKVKSQNAVLPNPKLRLTYYGPVGILHIPGSIIDPNTDQLEQILSLIYKLSEQGFLNPIPPYLTEQELLGCFHLHELTTRIRFPDRSWFYFHYRRPNSDQDPIQTDGTADESKFVYSKARSKYYSGDEKLTERVRIRHGRQFTEQKTHRKSFLSYSFEVPDQGNTCILSLRLLGHYARYVNWKMLKGNWELVFSNLVPLLSTRLSQVTSPQMLRLNGDKQTFMPPTLIDLFERAGWYSLTPHKKLRFRPQAI